MISLKTKTAEFGAEIDRIIHTTGKEAQTVLMEEGKLFLQDVVRLTPPFGSAPSTESFNAQRKIGEEAVERDIHRVFHVVDLSRIQRKSIRDQLEKLIHENNIEGAKAVLLDCRIPVQDVIREATPELAAKFRDGRGRVTKPKWIWVLKERSVDRVVRWAQAHIGQAKAGWAAAAQVLGVKLPNWITRHGTSEGSFELKRDAKAPKITLQNKVPYIQAAGAELRIVERALANRIKNMRAKLERIARSGWKKK